VHIHMRALTMGASKYTLKVHQRDVQGVHMRAGRSLTIQAQHGHKASTKPQATRPQNRRRTPRLQRLHPGLTEWKVTFPRKLPVRWLRPAGLQTFHCWRWRPHLPALHTVCTNAPCRLVQIGELHAEQAVLASGGSRSVLRMKQRSRSTGSTAAMQRRCEGATQCKQQWPVGAHQEAATSAC
jgi:hypothetical protein